MNPTDLSAQLHSSLQTLSPVPPALDDVRRAGLRRRRTREGLAGVLGVAVLGVGLVLLGGGDDKDSLTPADPPSPAPTTEASGDILAAWDAFLADHPWPHTEVYEDRGAVAEGTSILVAKFDGKAFQEEAHVGLADQDDITAIRALDLTGDGVPDFMATGPAGNAVLTSVVLQQDGRWQPATFGTCSGTQETCNSVMASSSDPTTLTGTRNPCTPSCAEATPRTYTYRWIGDRFVVPALAGGCAEGSDSLVWFVSDRQVEGDQVRLTYQVAGYRCTGNVEPYLEALGSERQVTVAASTPVTLVTTGGNGPSGIGSKPATAADMEDDFYEVTYSGEQITGFVQQYRP